MNKPIQDTLCFKVDQDLHQDIKERAIFLNISMKEWILQAIQAKITVEDKFK